MAKLYIFGIGGTGSRVLRSLTMLMAAGIDMKGYTVVPIIIDPDEANSDLTRTVQLLDSYASLRSKIVFPNGANSHFFATPVLDILNSFKLSIEGTGNKSFKQFIGLQSMSRENQAMTQMLFSDANLNSDMNVGFKGNPNIGSIVLNQIVKSNGFNTFANTFNNGDKIFIISSIFGGTGASGFPLLLKTLRYDKNIVNAALINRAEVGAITMLPYFKVENDNKSSIDSATFLSKAKAALKYYESNIVDTNEINALYYLGDDSNNIYENHEGGTGQNNQAHVLEMLAATAIVDFISKPHDADKTENNELAVKDSNVLSLPAFFPKVQAMLRGPMTRLILTANCFDEKMDFISSKKLAANKNLHDYETFYRSDFVSSLHEFLRDYKRWLNEMAKNQMPLELFDLDSKGKPFNVVTGVEPYKVRSLNSNYDLFFSCLNNAKTAGQNNESKLMEMFYTATRKMVQDKFKFD